MKPRQLTAIALLLLFVAACASSPAGNAYRAIGAVKIAVDGGMTYYADQVVAGKVSAADQARVKAAFQSYTAAAGAAAAIMRASTDPAPPDLTAAADALLNLLASLGVKGAKP